MPGKTPATTSAASEVLLQHCGETPAPRARGSTVQDSRRRVPLRAQRGSLAHQLPRGGGSSAAQTGRGAERAESAVTGSHLWSVPPDFVEVTCRSCPPLPGPGMARTSSPPEAERGKDRPWSLPLPDLPTLRGDVESSHGTRASRCDFSLPVRTRRFSASRRVQSPRSASAHGAGTLRCQTNARPLGCEAGCCLFRKKQRAQLTYAQIIGSVTFLIQTSC